MPSNELCAGSAAKQPAASRTRTDLRMSAFARFSGRVVLILNPETSTSFQCYQDRSNLAFVHPEHHRLLFPIFVGVANGQKVLARFAEHKQRRDRNRQGDPPVYVLTILEQIDVIVRDVQLPLGTTELKKQVVRRANPAISLGLNRIDSAAHITGPGAAVRPKERGNQEHRKRSEDVHMGNVPGLAEKSPGTLDTLIT